MDCSVRILFLTVHEKGIFRQRVLTFWQMSKIMPKQICFKNTFFFTLVSDHDFVME